MKTTDIFSAITRKESSQRPALYAMYEALIYSLWNAGYQRRHIADALGVHPDSVSYTIQTSRTHLTIGDKLVKSAVDELRKHKLEIKPYFEMFEGGIVRLRTSLYIDKRKFKKT